MGIQGISKLKSGSRITLCDKNEWSLLPLEFVLTKNNGGKLQWFKGWVLVRYICHQRGDQVLDITKSPWPSPGAAEVSEAIYALHLLNAGRQNSAFIAVKGHHALDLATKSATPYTTRRVTRTLRYLFLNNKLNQILLVRFLHQLKQYRYQIARWMLQCMRSWKSRLRKFKTGESTAHSKNHWVWTL